MTSLSIDKSTLRLNPSTGYFQKEYPKTGIVVHHTVGGSADSTYRYWHSSPDRIATAYIIERDGHVYETFDPEYWAFHLGIQNTEGRVDKATIGIELASEGALRSGKELNQICKNAGISRYGPAGFLENYLYAFDIDDTKPVGRKPFSQAYKLYSLDQTDKYVALSTPWRGYSYFDKYDDPQMESLVKTVKYLMNLFHIQPVFTSNTEFQQTLIDNPVGVFGHTNVRKDKSDPYIKFDWADFQKRVLNATP